MSALSQVVSNLHLWRSCLRGPLYIPLQARNVVKLLDSGGPGKLLGELERLSTLGSVWASATLGYFCLLPDPDGRRHPDRAIDLCRTNAGAGDPYALFILAWALLHSGRHRLAIRTMKKAALTGFPPATLDYVTFVWNGWGTKDVFPSAALKLLHHADNAHHKAALIWKCKMYTSGKFGILYSCFGYMMLPFARLKYVLAALSDPFSCRVFTFQTSATGPVLRMP